jgi:hypothetical protein
MSYYKSIAEFPLFRWNQCQEGRLEYTRRDTEKGSEKEDIDAWTQLNDDYIATFGINRKHARLLQLQRALLKARLDFMITEDRFHLNKIDDITQEIKLVFKDDEAKEGNDVTKALLNLSKWRGVHYSEITITVKEFFTLVEMYQQEQQKQK